MSLLLGIPSYELKVSNVCIHCRYTEKYYGKFKGANMHRLHMYDTLRYIEKYITLRYLYIHKMHIIGKNI